MLDIPTFLYTQPITLAPFHEHVSSTQVIALSRDHETETEDHYQSATVASPTFSTSLTQTLESLRSHLPAQLQALLPASPAQKSTSFIELFPASLQQYFNPITPEILIGLAISFFLVGFSMSRRFPYFGRHVSPVPTSISSAPPVVHEDDYTYMTHDDLPRSPVDSSYPPYRSRASDPSNPDILYVKHRNETIRLEWPAFSIAEGFLKVRMIRQYTADILNVDVRRVKLVYKGEILRDDEKPANDVGIKQHSELTAICTEGDYGDSDSEDEYNRRRGLRSEMDNTPNRLVGGVGASRREPGYSTPTTPSRNIFPAATSTSSASRPIATPSSSGNDSRASPAPQRLEIYKPPPESTPAREKIAHIMDFFRSQYLPVCQAFLDNPPKDATVRKKEATRLGETVFGQIQNRLDNIDTGGYEAVRSMRKGAVNEVLEVIKLLDLTKEAVR